jgi:hypothetical protein
MNADAFADPFGDPQDCRACLELGDICEYHEGFADGWDNLALVLADLAENERLAG